MSLFAELKRRNVFKVAIAYVIVSWLILQVIGSIVPIIEAPEWVSKAILIFLLAGFPIALLFAWAFELTPEGIKKESEIDRDESITDQTRSKINLIIIGSLILIIGGFAYDKFFGTSITAKPEQTEVIASESADQEIPLEIKSETNKLNDKSIAVLPFTNMSGTPDNESFTLGIHDDLLTHISKISALKVISRTSVLRYKTTEKPIPEIAKELGVKNILEGSVRTSGNQIRINVQLIDATTDEHLWAEIYDRKLTADNIFNIQTEISEKIAAALKAQLSPEELDTLSQKPTDNLEAYNAYLQGRQLLQNRKSSELKQALVLFQRATELDPNYALAYVNQAIALDLLNEYSDLPYSEYKSKTEPLISKALSINPLLSEAYASNGSFLMNENELDKAEKNFLRAIELNPNYVSSYHWYGRLLRNYLGRFKEALELHRKAAVLDPLSPVIQLNVAWSLNSLGQHEEAIEQFKLVNKLAPDYAASRSGLGVMYSIMGQLDLAVYWQLQAIKIDNGSAKLHLTLLNSYASLADIKNTTALYKKMHELYPDTDYTKNAKKVLDLFNRDYQQLYQISNQEFLQQRNEFSTQIALGYFSFMENNYKKSKELFLKAFSDKNEDSIKINKSNYQDILLLALAYKYTGQKVESKKLLDRLKTLTASLPTQQTYWDWIFIEMLQENNKAAADAYAVAIKNKRYNSWMFIEALISEDVKKEPVYIEAKKRLMSILEKQRENLIKLQSKGLQQ